jgi:hypothetical protein
MKIAVCFSGQFRTGLYTYENIKYFLGELYSACDFFIHTWDRNKDRNYNGSIIGNRESYLDDLIIQKITEIYNPKIFKIENYDKTIKKEAVVQTNNYELFGPIQPFWYSFMKSVEYKTDYELKNGFKYDYVLKLRPDIIFPNQRKLKHLLELFEENSNGMFIENTESDVDIESEFVDDVLFFGNSNTMDIASTYFIEYNKKYTLNKELQKYGFIKHLYDNSIKVLDMVGRTKFHAGETSYTIYRKECLKYSPINEYMKCFDCDAYYYKDAKTTDEKLFITELKEKYQINGDIFDRTILNTIFVDELIKK